MGPRVRRHLMTLGDHAPDERGVRVCDIDGAFAVVVASDEEGCCEVEMTESIEETGGVRGRAVVVG